jgi:predicted membrane chloride channel (bestrophin family)
MIKYKPDAWFTFIFRFSKAATFRFAGLELIAKEIENPFGTDSSDLPTGQICHNFRKQVNVIII